MTTTNYEIAKEKCKFYRAMNQDSDIVSAETSGSRSNLESELRSKHHDNKKASSNYKQTCLTHKADNVEDIKRVIVSESNEKNDDDSNNEDADHLESEQIMVPFDPSEWNCSHIASWISWCARTFSIKSPITMILPSTGKELLKLSLQDWQNVGGTGGRILARHLGCLHLQATGIYTPDLLQEDGNNADKRGPVEK